MNDLIFELKEVHFSYLGRYSALCDIDISIARGEKVTIIGANGSGKSTLLHMLDALIFPDQGAIRAFGVELEERLFSDEITSNNFRKKVGLVFQNPDVQLFCPTVKEDIIFGPLQLGVGKKKIAERLERLAIVLDIEDLLPRPPHRLSIGEKRKVAIASILITDPEVLILDEPTAGLDPLTTRHIIDLLIKENLSGKTIITSTHDLHIIEEISDTCYVFGHNKRIVKQGPPEAIFEDMELLHTHNLVHIHSHKHKNKVHVHPHVHVDHHPKD